MLLPQLLRPPQNNWRIITGKHGNQKEIKQRIVSVGSTKQITSAMKMVAAAKLRRVQDRIVRLRPYANKMQQILANVTESLGDSLENPFTQERDPDKVLVVVITSQRGLCGALNTNVVRKALDVARTYPEALQQNNVHFLTLGKKGADALKKKGYPLIQTTLRTHRYSRF